MSLRLLFAPPAADYEARANETTLWPAAEADTINCRQPDGLELVVRVDPAALVGELDEDGVAASIEASIAQLQAVRGTMSALAEALGPEDLTTMPRSEHRPGQRFSVPGKSVVVIFNTSRRIPALVRGGQDVTTYLDIGALGASAGPVHVPPRVDYSHKLVSSGGLRMTHSGDMGYAVGRNGALPGPGENPDEPKLVHIVQVDCVEDRPVRLVVAGFSDHRLREFTRGGILTIATPERLHSVVVDFTEADFGEARACLVATLRLSGDSVVVDVALPAAVVGRRSAPFSDAEFNNAALRSALPELGCIARALPIAADPAQTRQSVAHRVDCDLMLKVDMTRGQHAAYLDEMRTLESRAPAARTHLLEICDADADAAAYVPMPADRALDPASILGFLTAHRLAHGRPAPLAVLDPHGEPLDARAMRRSLNRMMRVRLVDAPAAEPAAEHARPLEKSRAALLLWTGVDDDSQGDDDDSCAAGVRAALGAVPGGSEIPELYAFSGVSTHPKSAGRAVHLPVATAGPEGLVGGPILKAATRWSGYDPRDAPAWLGARRTLVVAGPMSPAAAACASAHRLSAVYLMTSSSLAAFTAMAGPVSVLLMACADDPSACEWIDGVQFLLKEPHRPGDRIPYVDLAEWLIMGTQGGAVAVPRVLVGSAGELTDETGGGRTFVYAAPDGAPCDALELAERFVAADAAPYAPASLRQVGTPNCHALEALLRAAGRPRAAAALQAAVLDLQENPDRSDMLAEAMARSGDELEGHERAAELVLEAMRERALQSRTAESERAAAWDTLRFQVQWSASPAARQHAAELLSGGRYAVAPPPQDAAAPEAPEDSDSLYFQDPIVQPLVVDAAVARRRDRGAVQRERELKMLALSFDSSQVRTKAQLEIGRRHAALRSAAQLAKGMRIGANVAAVSKWTVGDLADHIDVLCGERQRCLFLELDISKLPALAPIARLRVPLGSAEVAALLEIPAARPQGEQRMLPVLRRRALGACSKRGGVVLCLPISDVAAAASEPWPDFQARSIAPEGDGSLRVAILKAMEPIEPDLAKRRAALRGLFARAAQVACEAPPLGQLGEHDRELARGSVVRLLCLWASGTTPLSWVFQLAQPAGMTHVPSGPDEWADVALLMELWPATGWREPLARNLAILAARVVGRCIQPAITALQKVKAVNPGCAPHPHDQLFMSAPMAMAMCGTCGLPGWMSKGQRRRSTRRGRVKKCIDCLKKKPEFAQHPQHADWAAGRPLVPMAAPNTHDPAAAAARAAERAARRPVPDEAAIQRTLGVDAARVFWSIVAPAAAERAVAPHELVAALATDLYEHVNATTEKRTQIQLRHFMATQ